MQPIVQMLEDISLWRRTNGSADMLLPPRAPQYASASVHQNSPLQPPEKRAIYIFKNVKNVYHGLAFSSEVPPSPSQHLQGGEASLTPKP